MKDWDIIHQSHLSYHYMFQSLAPFQAISWKVSSSSSAPTLGGRMLITDLYDHAPVANLWEGDK